MHPSDQLTPAEQVRRVIALKRFLAFRELPPRALATLADHVQENYFTKGTVIMRSGEPVLAAQFVVEGSVRVGDDEARARSFGPGSAFGGIAVFARDPNGISAVAEEATITFELDAEEMLDLFEENVEMSLGVLHALGTQLVEIRLHAGKNAGFPEAPDEREHERRDTLDLIERLIQLRRTPLWAAVRSEALADLAREAKQVSLRPGETLWREGDPADDLFVVMSGCVHASTKNEQEFCLVSGDVAGAVDALSRVGRWYDATVDGKFEALRIRADAVFDAIEDHPAIAIGIMRALAESMLVASGDFSGSTEKRPRTPA